LNPSHIVVQDSNRFTITPNGNGDLTNQGLYVVYKTRITAPVDNTTKKAFNNVKITTSTENFDVEGFAPLTTTEGISSGSRSTEVSFEVSKQLKGKDLAAEEFSFQLLDPNGSAVETVKNDKDGKVKFKAVKFSTVGTYKYQIKEVNDQKPGFAYDDKTINAEVTVTDVYGEKFASVKYDNKVFVNSYSVKSATTSITAKKVLNGKPLEADKYEFELKEGDKLVATAKNAADGTVALYATGNTKIKSQITSVTGKSHIGVYAEGNAEFQSGSKVVVGNGIGNDYGIGIYTKAGYNKAITSNVDSTGAEYYAYDISPTVQTELSRIGVNVAGKYEEILNTDSMYYQGSNLGNFGCVESEAIYSHGRENSISVSVPPLATVYLKFQG